jgi:acyl-CoA thioesterase FadM
MSLILRTLLVLLRAWRALRAGRHLAPTDVSVLPLRVWINDLDLNLHMNNGRYLTVMDLGRLDFILRAGLFRPVWQNRWAPLVGGATIRYRRSLRPFERYELCTRVLGWDDKWFYLEQRFVRRGELVAVGLVKALFRGRDGNVNCVEAMRMAGHEQPSPPLPAFVATWTELERLSQG